MSRVRVSIAAAPLEEVQRQSALRVQAAFGQHLRALRHDRSMTLEQLAEGADLHPNYVGSVGSMPFCVELDNLKDTDAPIHQPAAMLVAAD